jgi:hypothetical protein
VLTLALHGINGESAGNTTSWTRNPPEEGDSAGNYQFIEEESTQGRGFYRESPAYLHGFWLVRSKFEENPSNGNNSRISSSYPIY